MYEWVERLLALQDKDLRILRLEQQIRSVPTEKEHAHTLMKEAEEAFAGAKVQVQDDEKAIKVVEVDVESVQTKMRDFQAKSALIKSNEEYRAALAQIDGCKRQISGLEDQELVLLEKLDESRALLAKRTKELNATRERIAELCSDLDTRAENCGAQLAAEQASRVAARKELPSDVVKRYERQWATRQRAADKRVFVPVREGCCDRCHMKVTAQTRMNVRKGQAQGCEMCGAMLYFED